MLRARSCLLALVLGCNPPTPAPQSEAGVVRAPSCEQPDRITLVDGETVTREVDLRTAPFAIATDCPTDAAAGQVVYEILVPGTGPHTVEARTANPGTDRETDTVLSIRRDDCAAPAADQCFDELSGDYRTNAAFTAQGGDRVFLLLTAYAEEDEGPVEIEFSAEPNAPPTIASASVVVAGTELLVDVVGGDPDGNGAGVTVTLHGPAGELIDVDGNGRRDTDDTLTGNFSRAVTGTTSFAERTRLSLAAMGAAPRALSATSAYVRTVDRAGVASVTDVVAPVRAGTVVGRGEACSETLVCPEELSCAPGTFTCEPTPTRVAVCAAATPLGIARPTTTTTSQMDQQTLEPGAGLFRGDCDETDGRVVTDGQEHVYRITVPMGRYDLLLTTDRDGTGTDADTVIYVRHDCADPATGTPAWCNDDIERGANTRSALALLDIEEGDWFVFVEPWGSVALDTTLRYELLASLRPVLESGATCDVSEATNRCAEESCDAATGRCP